MHGFMPHGMCYLWRLDILLMHVVSDLVIGLAYFSIPLVLWVFSRRRPDLVYRPVAYLFIAFILFCGASHFLSIYTVWVPAYFAEGLVKIGTAVASVGTAIVLWPLLPRALAIPSVEQLAKTNESLRDEVERRSAAEAELTHLAENLERTVEARTDELQKSNATLKDFAAGASHDLKAPVRQVALLTDLALRDAESQLSDRARTYLEEVQSKSEGMLKLVDTLLSYSALLDTKPERETINLGEAINAIAAEFKTESETTIQIKVHGEGTVLGDLTLTTQLFSNLFENARKYSDQVTPRVDVMIEASPVRVLVTVRDNGPGIPKEYAETAFNMLQRYRTDVPGSGVGLAFCRRIMEALGGTISLDSTYTEGAAFMLEFPPTSALGDA